MSMRARSLSGYSADLTWRTTSPGRKSRKAAESGRVRASEEQPYDPPVPRRERGQRNMQQLTSLFQYDFMILAFAAILIIAPLFGVLGTMIVNNKMAFFSDALGHSALTGNCGGRDLRDPGYQPGDGDLRRGVCPAAELDQEQERRPPRTRSSPYFPPAVSPQAWRSCPGAGISASIPACCWEMC